MTGAINIKMPSTKVDKTNLIAKSGERPSRCRDAVILGISFAFTTAVACCILFYINNNQQQNVADIERIVEGILVAKLAKNVPRDYERKRGYLDEKQEDDSVRGKRAIHDFRPTNGENDWETFRSIFIGAYFSSEPGIVEFFNPKLRPELEKNDTELMKKTGLKGAAPKGDSWVWLTAYSRIPFEAIEGFCRETKDYCPPGPTGS